LAARIKPSTGAKSDKLWRDAIHRAVKQRLKGEGNPLALDQLARKLVDCALQGDIPALKEIGDRLDGKAVQGVEHGLAEGTKSATFIMHLDD
jgi:hypothetical protein